MRNEQVISFCACFFIAVLVAFGVVLEIVCVCLRCVLRSFVPKFGRVSISREILRFWVCASRASTSTANAVSGFCLCCVVLLCFLAQKSWSCCCEKSCRRQETSSAPSWTRWLGWWRIRGLFCVVYFNFFVFGLWFMLLILFFWFLILIGLLIWFVFVPVLCYAFCFYLFHNYWFFKKLFF